MKKSSLFTDRLLFFRVLDRPPLALCAIRTPGKEVKEPGVFQPAEILQVKGEEDYYYYQQQKQGIKPFPEEVA